jgi:hypothetical protein
MDTDEEKSEDLRAVLTGLFSRPEDTADFIQLPLVG